MHFFFYGTLIAGSANPVAARIHDRLRPLGAATVRGKLLAIPDPDGWYPALLPGDGRVHGALYAAAPDFASDDLGLIDAWEGDDYRRVVLDTDRGPAEGYVFVAACPSDAVPVPSGSFARFLAETGHRAFAG